MRGCAVSRRYTDVCNCIVFSVVDVYIDHLKFCVVCIYGQIYVCCGECNVVSNESSSSSSSYHQTIFFHSSAHCFPTIIEHNKVIQRAGMCELGAL